MRRHALKLVILIVVGLTTGCAPREEPRVGPSISPESPKSAERTDPWILVDSAQDRVVIYKKGATPLVFQNIAVGAAGVKEKLRRGDDVTPHGTYQVAWIRRQSKFVHFIGLNYPSIADAQRGLETGRIDRHTFERIKYAHARGEVPPQDTPLGGFIGLHGVGKGSLEVHRMANWTGGCIAVENTQIKQLTDIVSLGTVVEIR